jgi:hypothetical protein
MYLPLPDTVQLAERLQERALRAQGYDPRVLIEEVREHRSHSERALRKIRKAEKNNKKLDFVSESLRASFNEKAYDVTADFREHFENPCVTKYDRDMILQRFCNISALCHTYFNEPERVGDVCVSTLPLSILNGLCVKPKEGQSIIFLNEGVLFFGPRLIKQFSEIPSDHLIWDKIANGIQTGQAGLEVSRSIGDFLNNFLFSVSDGVTPYTLTDQTGERLLASAFEGWVMRKEMGIRQSNPLKRTLTPEEEAIFPEKGREILYYRSRGFIIFLLAHEFAHFYLRHNEERELARISHESWCIGA